MQKITVALTFDDEKFRALDTYLKIENATVQKKLEEAMEQLYEKTVPKPVQEYVAAITGTKTKRPTRPIQAQQEAPKKQPSKETPSAEVAE